MATITTAISSDYLSAYDGYDEQEVGLGLISPNIYATPSYQSRKIENLAIGLISDIRYAGFEHDPQPLILPYAFESRYQTILCLNLHYVPEAYRRAIMKFILDSNKLRIMNNQSMMVDFQALKRAVPVAQYIVRRMKNVGIRVNETFPLSRIPEAISGTNRWQSHYRTIMEGSRR